MSGAKSRSKARFQVEEISEVTAHRRVASDVDRFGESTADVESVGEEIDECRVVTTLDFIEFRVRNLVLGHSHSPSFWRS